MPAIKVDMEELVMALESQAESGDFFLDKNSGELVLISDYTDDDADAKRQQLDEEPDRFLYIQPIASHVGWGIMDDFVQSLKNRNAQEVLERALNGRKPFRSFKDELLRLPDIREQWFAYHAGRVTEIARDWLEENEVVFEETKTAVSTDLGMTSNHREHFKALQEITSEDDAAGLTFKE